MRAPSARRELAFVLAVAAAGVALVLVVAFAPWYPVVSDPAVDPPTMLSEVVGLFLGAPGSRTPTP